MSNLKYILLGLLLGAGGLFLANRAMDKNKITTDSDVVIEQIKAVNKVVVSEGLFSEIYTYKDATSIYSLIPLEKKMILLVKGKASVSYNLDEIDYQIDRKKRIITLINVPAPEIIVEPEVKYYDVQDYMLYSFSTEEYNIVSKAAVNKLKSKIDESELRTIARKQLALTLNQMQWVGKENGWKVELPKT